MRASKDANSKWHMNDKVEDISNVGNSPIVHTLKGTFKISIKNADGHDIVPESNVTDATITIERVDQQ